MPVSGSQSMFDAVAWAPVAAAVLAALVAALLVRYSRSRLVAALLRVAVALAAFVATIGCFAWTAEHDRAAALRALAMRQAALTAQATAPGSPLACLDDMAGETVGSACEKAIFARPESVAAAVSLVAARLSLLADMSRQNLTSDPGLRAGLSQLRHAIELDRYGLAAHVLSERDGCTADKCPAFAWLGDTTVLKSNLRGQPYGVYVDRYAAQWNAEKKAPQTPVAAAAPGEAAHAESGPKPAQPSASFASRYDFPSAASIPPVSIMNAEPPRTDAPAAPAAAGPPQSAAANGHLPMPPKRPAAPAAAADEPR